MAHAARIERKYPIIDWYAKREVQAIGMPQFSYGEREKDLQISIPTRLSCLGASGAGKSQWLLSFIMHLHCFKVVILACPRTDEDLYVYFIKHHADFGVKKVLCIHELEEWGPLWEEINKRGKQPYATLVILDDFLSESSVLPKPMLELFVRGRKLNISAAVLSSSNSDIDARARKNIDLRALLRFNNNDDVSRILHQAGLNAKEALPTYLDVVSQPGHAFLIDNSSRAIANRELQYRDNFVGIPMSRLQPSLTEQVEESHQNEHVVRQLTEDKVEKHKSKVDKEAGALIVFKPLKR